MVGASSRERRREIALNERAALAFVKKQGVVLMSARGPVPNLAEAIAGEPIRGSWWGHPKSHHMYAVFEAVCDSGEVLVCRLVEDKITLVHRRLWPALVRLADWMPSRGLIAVRQEHTVRGHHRNVLTPFPRWVPEQTRRQAKRLTVAQAVARVSDELLSKISARKFVQPNSRLLTDALGLQLRRAHRAAKPER